MARWTICSVFANTMTRPPPWLRKRSNDSLVSPHLSQPRADRNTLRRSSPAIQAGPAPPANPLTAAEKLEQKRDRVGKLLESGRHKSALVLANKLVREQPRGRECWEELAVVWAAKGNTQRSLAATEAVIACAPRDPWSYRSACMRALRLEGWAACLDFAERGKRLKIDRTVRDMMMEDYGLFGARALHALGRHEEALTWLTKVAMVDAFHGSREDPLLDPRRLRKACRVALTKSL
jgi:tetratricopeptide (TPR) repeat protein